MNIVMMTNTFTPHVGGVANSVAGFTQGYRARGHRVLVVAPVFPEMPVDEPDTVRIPAIQNFNGSDFSAVLSVPGRLDEALDDFAPDLIHAHHPFLIGSTAMRVAAERDCPLVFTHHTRYEAYTHYVPGNSPLLKRFVIELSTHYANSCDAVFAPSDSIAQMLTERGVETPISVVPTGIDQAAFGGGDGEGFRRAQGIPETARVVGHVGRLAEEKNLDYLAQVMVQILRDDKQAHCLIVGDGPMGEEMDAAFARAGLSERLHRPGAMALPELADAYAAMDVFAFASQSETQGMVVAEAMTAGLPVVALDAPGVREVVDNDNGYRLPQKTAVGDFARAVAGILAESGAAQTRRHAAIARTAQAFSQARCVDAALAQYADLLDAERARDHARHAARIDWHSSLRRVQGEWSVISGMAKAAGKALVGERDEPAVE